MKQNYIGFARSGSVFGPATGRGDFTPKLPSGHYKVSYDNEYDDNLTLTSFTPRTDEILNLGCKEFNYALKMAESFFKPETAKVFKEQGFLLKRSFLFYGPPGTGKSVLSCKISDVAIERKNGIAIYPDSYAALERFLEVFNDTDKGRFVTIVLEEFDSLIDGRHEEGQWTTLLDGQFQTDNRLILATTNHITQIPGRLLRPGRFSSLIEIPALDSKARDTFLKSKGIAAPLRERIVDSTKDFTIDDLKEVVQGAVILGDEIDNIIKCIKRAKEFVEE